MNELNVEFNNYINEFQKLNTDKKREEFIKQLKDFLAILTVIGNSEGLKLEYLKNREILDLKNEFVSEDDFIEASLVYLENAKNIVGQIFEKTM